MGLGSLASDHPKFLGMLGMHGTYESNMAMYECDVMLAVGARFDDRVTGDLKKFSPNAKIIHIDIDPASIERMFLLRYRLLETHQQLSSNYTVLWRILSTRRIQKFYLNGGRG